MHLQHMKRFCNRYRSKHLKGGWFWVIFIYWGIYLIKQEDEVFLFFSSTIKLAGGGASVRLGKLSAPIA